MIKTSSGLKFDFWACKRPLTSHWGSGDVLIRLIKHFGRPDVVFGKQDQVCDSFKAIDLNTGYDWKKLPFEDNHFKFGYWDPPYYELDKEGKATLKPSLYKNEGIEIWRTVNRLAILHTHIFPRAWLKGAIREGMVAITMGPMKQIRCLQVFKKQAKHRELF